MEISFPAILWELYDLSPEDYQVEKSASGHINQTFILRGKARSFVLQQVNHQVFKNPGAIAQNIRQAANYLKANHPDYLFIAPLSNRNGEELTLVEDNYWRLLTYITNSVALDVLNRPIQAFEAAKAFGKLCRYLNEIDTADFQPTIPQFHDLAWRKQQFDKALEHAHPSFKNSAKQAIDAAIQNQFIVAEFLEVQTQLPIRIAHHDTKISNVLLDENTFEGICVIDLDTLMPGYFISDLGDMMRTYLCAFDENEANLSKINIREDYFKATIQGYLSEMGGILIPIEKKLLLFSGKYMIYMQALRFLTDFLEGSTYYPILYPLHNLDRSLNQFQLLSQLFKKELILEKIIQEHL